jgi:Lsr2
MKKVADIFPGMALPSISLPHRTVVQTGGVMLGLTLHTGEREHAAMAQKVEVKLIDDLDGGTADETISFSLDGTQYVIDLSEKHATQLRESMAKYVEAARKEKNVRATGRGGRTATAAASGPDTSEVRTWAKAQGYEVSERGRVAKDLIVKFQEAHG